MKVNKPNSSNMIDAYKRNNNKVNKKNNKKATNKAAKVELSKEAIAFKEALKNSKTGKTSDIEKVERIKKSIQEGTYKVDSSKIADSIIQKAKGNDWRV